jgi:hypothetical protein
LRIAATGRRLPGWGRHEANTSGTTSAARSGEGQYQVVFNTDVKACTYTATLGDPADGAPPAGELTGDANGVLVVTRDQHGRHDAGPAVPPDRLLLRRLL